MIDPKAVEHPAPSDQDIAGWAKTSEPLLLLDCISDAHNLYFRVEFFFLSVFF